MLLQCCLWAFKWFFCHCQTLWNFWNELHEKNK